MYSVLSGVSMNLLHGERGKVLPGQVSIAIKPTYDWLPRTRLVVLENTCNKGGGSIYTHQEATAIVEEARQHGLAAHLDGARLFNALVETSETPTQWGQLFDSISICLSKGLGAPVGSLLLGTREFIDRARRYRKVFGGGMRQAGYLAAAGLYALDHHVERLRHDNQRARTLAATLVEQPYVASVETTESNICIFHLRHQSASDFLEILRAEGILATLPLAPVRSASRRIWTCRSSRSSTSWSGCKCWLSDLLTYRNVGDGINRADGLTKQAGDVTGAVYRNRIEGAHEACLLGADRHTGPAVDAGIPADAKQDGLLLTHIFLNSEVGLK